MTQLEILKPVCIQVKTRDAGTQKYMTKSESWVLRRWQIGRAFYFNMGRNCFDWHILSSEPRKSTEVVLSPQWKTKFSLGSQKGRVESFLLLLCLTTSHKCQPSFPLFLVQVLPSPCNSLLISSKNSRFLWFWH